MEFEGYFSNSKLPDYKLIDGVEIHILLSKKDSIMLAWSLVSFIKQTGICPKIIIHDDGSFDKKTAKRLESKFPELKVLFLTEANMLINMTNLTPKLLEHRKFGHKLIYKLIDIFSVKSVGKKLWFLIRMFYFSTILKKF